MKVGDKITRHIKGFNGETWSNEGVIIGITTSVVEAEIMVDTPRRMEFGGETGINLHGKMFGWIGV